MPKIPVLHGPNLNLLGQRESHHYGNDSLEAINQRLVERGKRDGAQVDTSQSNAFMEVHLSNIHAREPFRHHGAALRSIEPRSK